MKRIREMVVPALALMLIAGAVTAALAGTNALTENIIAAQSDRAADEARREVINAEEFRAQTVALDGTEITYYEAIAGGAVAGYVFTAESVGKSSGLTVMTGISKEGTITGVKVTEQNETAGYVEKVQKAGFLQAFTGKEAREIKLNEQVDAVSQATKTSTGICKAVNKAIAAYRAVKEGATVE